VNTLAKEFTDRVNESYKAFEEQMYPGLYGLKMNYDLGSGRSQVEIDDTNKKLKSYSYRSPTGAVFVDNIKGYKYNVDAGLDVPREAGVVLRDLNRYLPQGSEFKEFVDNSLSISSHNLIRKLNSKFGFENKPGENRIVNFDDYPEFSKNLNTKFDQ
jgi:hypothetical protein